MLIYREFIITISHIELPNFLNIMSVNAQHPFHAKMLIIIANSIKKKLLCGFVLRIKWNFAHLMSRNL